MKLFKILASRSFVFLILAVLFIPAAAQDDGGFIIYRGSIVENEPHNFHGSQLYCTSSDCSFILDFMYMPLVGVDPELGWYAPDQRGAIAKDWIISDDSRTVTVSLRDDLFWSDGTPITSDDVMMTVELFQNADSNPAGEDGVRFYNELVQSVEAPDSHTIVFTFNQGSCDALNDVDNVRVVPAHIYRQLIEDVGYAELHNHEWFDNPSVVSGAFQWGDMADDGTITLLRNKNYSDAVAGQTPAQGIIQLVESANFVPRTASDFLAGEENVVGSVVPPEVLPSYVEAAERGELQLFQYPQNQIAVMGLNLADPSNPQPAFDESGNRIEQGIHPVFGDRTTRQALAHALDVQQLIDEHFNKFAYRLASMTIPASWAYNFDLEPIPYDTTVALELFAASGWVPQNPEMSPSLDNPLVCQDCLYAQEVNSDFNGSAFEFTLKTPGAGEYETAGRIFQQQLAEIGIHVTIDSDNWGSFTEQTYDAVIVGLSGGYPYVASTGVWFDPLQDLSENYVNITSFYNEAYLALEETAATLPGCGLAERAEIYRQIQRILQEEQPFIFLYGKTGVDVAKNEIQNFAPYPNNLIWNIDTWRVVEDE